METISLKLESNLLKEMDDNLVKHRYSTRTEFIRDAIRQKLSELEKEEIIMNLRKIYGSSNRKTTDKQLHAAGEKAFKVLEKRHGPR